MECTSVDLSSILQDVYVSPESPSWYRDVVEDLVKRYGLQVPVRQSGLDAVVLL